MAYKVLIVDDESIMRDGLANLVDWGSMGFEIAEKLEDGQEAIEYLQKHSVEVVLTDIKMTFVSGLDLAKYIHENKLNIKVVIISAYKEFEFAQKAISYNVVHYLLKPVVLKDITRVFGEIKSQLDNEHETRQMEILQKNKIDELLMLSRKQFFTACTAGAFVSEAEIRSRLQLLGFSADFQNNRCCILNIRIGNYEEYVNSSWNYSKEGLNNAIRNFFINSNPGILFFDTGILKDTLQFIAVQLGEKDKAFAEELEKQLSEIRKGIDTFLGLSIEIFVQGFYENIMEMALSSYKEEKQNLSPIDDKEQVKIDLNKVVELQKLVFSHILTSEPDISKRLFEKYIEEIRPSGIKALQKSIIDFFALLVNKFRESGADPEKCSILAIDYSDFFECRNTEEILVKAGRCFESILGRIKSEIVNNKVDVITTVKVYISQHFNEDITLEDAANYVFLSPVYLSRFFKEKTGENFIDYVIKIKMEKAMEYLDNPEYKVYDVSRMVGYNSIKYFYRLFKKYNSCTPTEYRTRNNKTE